jgi:hypothetical protein
MPSNMFEAPGRVKRRSSPAFAVPLLMLVCLAACRTPIENVNDAELPPAARSMTLEQIDEAIWRAGRKVKWDIEIQGPGELRAIWRHKAHLAIVRITHDHERLSILYESSENLVRDGKIHRHYNAMVQRLLRQIRIELGAAPTGPTH